MGYDQGQVSSTAILVALWGCTVVTNISMQTCLIGMFTMLTVRSIFTGSWTSEKGMTFQHNKLEYQFQPCQGLLAISLTSCCFCLCRCKISGSEHRQKLDRTVGRTYLTRHRYDRGANNKYILQLSKLLICEAAILDSEVRVSEVQLTLQVRNPNSTGVPVENADREPFLTSVLEAGMEYNITMLS